LKYCIVSSVTRHKGWRAEIWKCLVTGHRAWRKVSMWHTSYLGNFVGVFCFLAQNSAPVTFHCTIPHQNSANPCKVNHDLTKMWAWWWNQILIRHIIVTQGWQTIWNCTVQVKIHNYKARLQKQVRLTAQLNVQSRSYSAEPRDDIECWGSKSQIPFHFYLHHYPPSPSHHQHLNHNQCQSDKSLYHPILDWTAWENTSLIFQKT